MALNTPLIKKDDKNMFDVDFLEVLVYDWIRRSIYFTRFRLTNYMLKTIALKFKTILNLKSFDPDQEWVQNFRVMHNIHEIDTIKLENIGYKSAKSTLPLDIFNELKPAKVSLNFNPRNSNSKEPQKRQSISVQKAHTTKNVEAKQKTKQNSEEIKTTNLLFDFEDELPVCTIFGRNTAQNIANKESDDNNKKFQPKIVQTVPKNPELHFIEKTNSNAKLQEENKLYFPSTEPKFINQFIKNIDNLKNADYKMDITDIQLENFNRNAKNKKNEQKTKNKKTKTNQNIDKKLKTIPLIKQISDFKTSKQQHPVTNQTTLPSENAHLPKNSNALVPLTVPPLKSSNITVPALPTPTNLPNNINLQNSTQIQSPINTGNIFYKISDNSTVQLPYLSPITTSELGQTTNLTPIFLQFPVLNLPPQTETLTTLQSPPMIINLQQAPFSQTSLPTTVTALTTNAIPNQIFSNATVNAQQFAFQQQTPVTVATPSLSTSITTNPTNSTVPYNNSTQNNTSSQTPEDILQSKKQSGTLIIPTNKTQQTSSISTQMTTPVPNEKDNSLSSNTIDVKKYKLTERNSKGTRFAKRKPLRNKEELLKCVKLMEEFAMMMENYRFIGFLDRLQKEIDKFK